jgi:hypothetical protein
MVRRAQKQSANGERPSARRAAKPPGAVAVHVLAHGASGPVVAVSAPERSRAVHLMPSPGMDVIEFVITWSNGLRATLQSLLDNGREVLDYMPTGDGVVGYKYETFHAGEHVLDWDVVAAAAMTSLRAHAGVNASSLKTIGDKDSAQRWQFEGSI